MYCTLCTLYIVCITLYTIRVAWYAYISNACSNSGIHCILHYVIQLWYSVRRTVNNVKCTTYSVRWNHIVVVFPRVLKYKYNGIGLYEWAAMCAHTLVKIDTRATYVILLVWYLHGSLVIHYAKYAIVQWTPLYSVRCTLYNGVRSTIHTNVPCTV